MCHLGLNLAEACGNHEYSVYSVKEADNVVAVRAFSPAKIGLSLKLTRDLRKAFLLSSERLKRKHGC